MKPRPTIQWANDLLAAGKIRGYQVTSNGNSQVTLAGYEKKRSKYGSQECIVDGIKFDSKKEARRYGVLKLMMKAGEIGQLELQKCYELKVEGQRVCKYYADFVYMIMATGETIVEDVKSEATRLKPSYRLKNKLMKAIYGITIKEV